MLGTSGTIEAEDIDSVTCLNGEFSGKALHVKVLCNQCNHKFVLGF